MAKSMYVYFNDIGEVKCISPILDESSKLLYVKMNIDEVEPYISGKRSLNSCLVIRDQKIAGKYTLKQKTFDIKTYTVLDKFLYEVPYTDADKFHIKITNHVSKNKILVEIDSKLRNDILDDTEGGADYLKIEGLEILNFYFTAKHDPSILIHSISVPTQPLIKYGGYEDMYNTALDLVNTSVFTKKIFPLYTHRNIL